MRNGQLRDVGTLSHQSDYCMVSVIADVTSLEVVVQAVRYHLITYDAAPGVSRSADFLVWNAYRSRNEQWVSWSRGSNDCQSGMVYCWKIETTAMIIAWIHRTEPDVTIIGVDFRWWLDPELVSTPTGYAVMHNVIVQTPKFLGLWVHNCVCNRSWLCTCIRIVTIGSDNDRIHSLML